MFPRRYCGRRFFAPRYFAQGPAPESARGGWFGHRYFGRRYFATHYFPPAIGEVIEPPVPPVDDEPTYGARPMRVRLPIKRLNDRRRRQQDEDAVILLL